ncbi:MAG TPA: dipeptide/oligopeptide/nickel ABC transporter ATP-binding protein [Firmicutes bacterium]|nr:dipeptide/oligopeptide/nickel ABC transporter ATP-binding protein [Bacillota bacterium]
MENLLEVQDLTKIFGAGGGRPVTAADHVTFSLRAGEALGLVGESGCGKSTLARMIARLLEPTAGAVFLEGEEITKLRRRALRPVYRKMQMVFQSPAGSFDPRRTLGHGIAESLENRGLSRGERQARTAQLLERCGLPADFAGRYPHEVSGGQCQRAAIARALAAEPRLLICDEATSALDVTVQQQILELLGELRRDGLSILFICHNLALVQSFCDRVLVMRAGKIVEAGNAADVIAAPRTDYTRSLLDAVL